MPARADVFAALDDVPDDDDAELPVRTVTGILGHVIAHITKMR